MAFCRPSLREGRSQEAETGAELGGVLLTVLFPMACLDCFYRTQDYSPEGGSTYSGLWPPTSIINQENFPETCPTGQSEGGNSLL